MQERQVRTKSRFEELLDAKDYTVFDLNSEKIGKVDDLYVVNRIEPRYLGVKTGLMGSKMTLIPIEAVKQVDRDDTSIWVSIPKDVAKSAPTFELGHHFTPEEASEIWAHYGLSGMPPAFQEIHVYEWRVA